MDTSRDTASSSQDNEPALQSERKNASSTDVARTDGQEQQQPEQNDIYRGEPPPPPRSRPPSLAISSSSSSSSSSGRSGLGLRRGALGAILDRAINRWARARSDTSTISSTSSSTSIRNRTRRWKRRSSIATSQNTNTENIIRARRRAWEQGRGLPREFVLFLPASLAPPAVDNRFDHTSQDRRVFRSTSLPLVLSHLDSAIKHSAKPRKHKQHAISSTGKASGQQNIDDVPPSVPSSYPLLGEMPVNSKGKIREDIPIHKPNDTTGAEKPPRRPAWWLDVSSPTWNDMREIGKLLHIHPLTLEDILHQEPREKLEVFPRLGYYFIVFRALDSELTRAKAQTQLDLTMKGDTAVLPFSDGTIGATNVYIVVFKEGICTFHFEDISDHTLRVRNRIIKLEETFHMSSDWIAHGILDSIVDQFFPLLNSIEQEVKDLDDLVLSINGPLRNRRELGNKALPNRPITKPVEKGVEKVIILDTNGKSQMELSTFNDEVPKWSRRCVRPFVWVTRTIIHSLASTSASSKLKQWSKWWRRKEPASPFPLVRMASTRKLVTSLTRLLGTKSEVVSQIRKRLTGSGLMGSYAISSEQALAGEVGIYLGDIQDHILALQQSLGHYERTLSHSHPAYLSHLRVAFAQATARMDHKLFYLSLISVTIISMQIPVGIESMNIRAPRNLRMTTPPDHPAPFNAFGIMLVIEALIALIVISLTRYWWRRAERKFARARQLKL